MVWDSLTDQKLKVFSTIFLFWRFLHVLVSIV